ncbi:MAG: PilN domain-containing protein [Thermodesulfobacteriota bacterium]
MIKTNLLPYRAARKKENIRRQLSVFVLFFVFVAVALSFYHFHLASSLSHLSDRLAVKEKELKEYQDKVQEVDKIKAQLAVLEQKLKVMEQLKKDRKDAVDLMNALMDLTVKENMWITSVSEKGGGISIDGIAIDNRTVAVFMSRIEKSTFFSGVVLKDLVAVDQSGLKLKKFSLQCSKSA